MPHAIAKRTPRLEELTGAQKAAVVLMALGPEASTEITDTLTSDELEAISFEIAQLDQVPAELVEKVLEEWQHTEHAAYTLAEGGVDVARKILEQALGPSKAAVVLRRIESQIRDSGGFYKLRKADPQQLTNIVRHEHPQTIALILAHLEPPLVAEVVKQLPAALGSDVLYRMARMEKVLPEVLQVVEHSLGTESTLSLSQDLTAAGGPSSVAEVLNLLAGSEKELLEGIEGQDHALSEEIKGLMFVFQDLIRLDEKALQRVMKEVETKELALALKAASEDLKQRIKGTMSQRAVNALEEEIEFLGPVRLRDVEQAQGEIVKLVRGLEEAGEIVIGAAAEDYVE